MAKDKIRKAVQDPLKRKQKEQAVATPNQEETIASLKNLLAEARSVIKASKKPYLPATSFVVNRLKDVSRQLHSHPYRFEILNKQKQKELDSNKELDRLDKAVKATAEYKAYQKHYTKHSRLADTRWKMRNKVAQEMHSLAYEISMYGVTKARYAKAVKLLESVKSRD